MKRKVIGKLTRVYANGRKVGLRGYHLECGHVVGPHTRGAAVGELVWCQRCDDRARTHLDPPQPLVSVDERARLTIEGWVVIRRGAPMDASALHHVVEGVVLFAEVREEAETTARLARAAPRLATDPPRDFVVTRASLTVQAPTVVREPVGGIDWDEID